MCFSISVAKTIEHIEERFEAKFSLPGDFKQYFHVSAFSLPKAPVITNEDTGAIQMFRWGLIPHWTKDRVSAESIRVKTFNARSETAGDKPSYRNSVSSKRCMVLVDGFFEWRHLDGKKIPYYIRTTDGDAFSLAGLWDEWSEPGSSDVEHTFTIMTTRANPLLAKIHNSKERMPVIMTRNNERSWLEDGLSLDEMDAIYEPIDDAILEAYPVSRVVSYRDRDTNVPEAILPFDYPELRTEQQTLF